MGEYKIRPNLYVVMVAPPGAGKSIGMILPIDKVYRRLTSPLIGNKQEIDATKLIWEKFIPAPGHPLRLVTGRVTPERLAQLMKKAEHTVMDAPGDLTSSALTIKTNEFGMFMTQQNQFLQVMMTEGWDGVDIFEYQTKNMGDDIVHGMCLNWIAAATPSEFVANMPANATEQGLLSRILPIYYNGPTLVQRMASDGYAEEDIVRLAEDLGQIAGICGAFEFQKGVREEIVQPWIDAGMEPAPTSIMLTEYNSRRLSHLIKICMAVSAARRDTKIIEKHDWHTACAMLFEAEKYMPDLLRRFGMSDGGRFADDVLDFAIKNADKTGCIRKSIVMREAIRLARNLNEIETTMALLTESKQLIAEGDFYKVPI